jgi:septum formation protein
MKSKIILASSSPRRRELLTQAGYEFTVVTSDVPEERCEGETPLDYCRRLAREKAEAVLARIANRGVERAFRPANKIAEVGAAPEVRILGADTIVVVDDRVLGKPEDAEHAREMLELLSGRAHQVITAVCLLTSNANGTLATDIRHAITTVTFCPMSTLDIETYIASGEPLDKAGAYGIQGGASRFIAGYEGDYDNVVGLPVFLVREMLSGY